MTQVEESSKPKRALIAAEQIKKAESKQGDVWAFMESVLTNGSADFPHLFP